MPVGAPLFDVFMSHCTADGPIAEMLVDGLEQAGLQCWFAPRNVVDDHAEEIPKAIRASRVLVFLISSDSLESLNCYTEIRIAFDQRRPIVTVRLDDTPLTDRFDYFIGHVQWIRYDGPATIETLRRRLPVADPSPVGPSDNTDPGSSLVDLYLLEAGHQRLQVIRVLREAAWLSLAEAVRVLDALPHRVVARTSWNEAKPLADRLVAAGAKVGFDRL